MSSYPSWVQRLNTEHLDQDVIAQVKKRTIRALYGVAMMHGAPYERSWRNYRSGLVEFADHHVSSYDLLIGGSCSPDTLRALTSAVLSELIEGGAVVTASA